jgi:SAM-dependent methyltransferase
MIGHIPRNIDDYNNTDKTPYNPNPEKLQSSLHRNLLALDDWIKQYKVGDKEVLEVGCGTGYIQSVIEKYYGIDITIDYKSFIYKPFINGSADSLPFMDNTFDVVISHWVLEHIPNPQLMLDEIRRVLRPGGMIFLIAAYSVDTWVSQGLHKRSYSDLTIKQKLIKLTIPMRKSSLYRIIVRLSYRLGDMINYLLHRQPTQLRYRELVPNLETYWDYDADAFASIDSYSTALYFLSRGDKPVYPAGFIRSLIHKSQPLVFAVNK